MNNKSTSLEKIGFDQWLQAAVAPETLHEFDIARVVSVHKDSYTISNGEADVLAELVGKLLFSASSPMDYPATGDWVLANFYDDNTFAIIHDVLPRKSLLKRKTPGKKLISS
jgi:ribosome biogenesis GTPase / thiamine phosphate phosphatase